MLSQVNHRQLAFDFSLTVLVAIATYGVVFTPFDQLQRAIFQPQAQNTAFIPSVFLFNLLFNGVEGMVYGLVIFFSKKNAIKACLISALLKLLLLVTGMLIQRYLIHMHNPPVYLVLRTAYDLMVTIISVSLSIWLVKWLGQKENLA